MTSIKDQQKIFQDFRTYSWLEDKVFQSGVASILQANKPTDHPLNQDYTQFQQHDSLDNDLQLLRAKHFYYSKFKQPFDFEQYLAYELEQQQLEEEAKYERLEAYDFDGDENYVRGLPMIIQNWVQQQVQGKVFWDKAHLDSEFVKAKAFYYSSCVEKLNVVNYFGWKHKKEIKEEPACPFANLWQNKGKADLGPQVIADNYLAITRSKFIGPTTITFASPRSQNLITVSRLEEWNTALTTANTDTSVTSIFLTTTVTNLATDLTDRIETKDTKLVSTGLAYDATYQHLTSSSDNNDNSDNDNNNNTTTTAALDHLSSTYYTSLRSQYLNSSTCTKPTFIFINGQIPYNATYMSLWPGYLRIATEHTLLECHLAPSHAPIPPLLLLQLLQQRHRQQQQHQKQQKQQTDLPAGWDLYLALAPPELGKLRGPELLRLGFVDLFIPESQLKESLKGAQRMALCPSPLTTTAVQLALDPSYPGPERISIWKQEIATVFTLDSLEEVQEKLKSMESSVWSQKILAHWQTLPPALLKAVFKAVHLSRTMTSLKDILDLEERMGRQWRHSLDYQEFLKGGSEWQKENVDDLVDFYFDETDSTTAAVQDENDREPFVYKVSEKDLEPEVKQVDVCPVTGQRGGGAVCPVTGQQEQSDGCPFSKPATSCPVTGQQPSSEISGCPVSGQQQSSTTASCPVSGLQSSSTASCPVSGQQSSATASCPVSGQQSSATASCPVSGQQSSATASCPVSGQSINTSLD